MRDESRHLCVVGIQWGDEGKGKIVDALTRDFDVVVRYQGGANAGHTVRIGEREYIFHLIPSGILQEGKTCVIGGGVALDPRALIEEIDRLKADGLAREDQLWISDRAHVVLPYHQALDVAKEAAAKNGRIGTTLRGIGPCYTDKTARQGIRMLDLVDPDRFRRLVVRNVEQKNAELTRLYGCEPVRAEAIIEEYTEYGRRLAPCVRDIASALWERHRAGARIMFEGAQGLLLDLDLGTYPFVTSSNTSFLGLGPGTGFSPRRVGTVLGVAKAYCTRVGEGPFPTELEGASGEELRRVGAEFGATTGRPRRCGWLDMVAVRYAIQVGDVDALVITKLDVLDGLKEIKVATAYESERGRVDSMPSDVESDLRPVYDVIPGWEASTADCRRAADLPVNTLSYLQYIADRSRCPVAMVSVGQERSALIRFEPWLPPRFDDGS